MTKSNKIITIISTKGGVGKTTLTANLAGYLSSIGKRVLMVDADPQPSLSSYYKIIHQAKGGIVDLFNNPEKIKEYISKTPYADLIYSNDPNNQLQLLLPSLAGGRNILQIALQYIVNDYDYIIIDTQGAKGALQDAAVFAADILISPVLPEAATIKEFNRGTLKIINDFKFVKQLPKIQVIAYRVDNTADSSTNLKYLQEQKENDYYTLLQTQIPSSVVFRDAIRFRKPVCEFKNGNKKMHDKAQKSFTSIENLTKELLLTEG